jgi:hypothetical protein
MAEAPAFAPQKRTTSQLAGIRYERQTLTRLENLYKVERQPWLSYRAANRQGICQPDALLWLSPERLVIVEIKLSRVDAARRKLQDFYGPIVAALHPAAKLSYLQIYKNPSARSHKTLVNINELDKIGPNTYRECHHL